MAEASGSAVSIDQVRPVLSIYYRALSAREAELMAQSRPEDRRQFADTATTIRLPPRAARFSMAEANFGWFKVALTHRAAHYEAGTFRFSLDVPAALYPDTQLPPAASLPRRHPDETDLQVFFRLFSRRALAVDVFTVLEDFRLDEWCKRTYPGLRLDFDRVQADALSERPGLRSMPPRAALAEILVRLSLGARDPLSLPRLLHEPVRQLRAALDPLASPAATVTDTAEATLRAYALVTRLPNLDADYGDAELVDPSSDPLVPAVWRERWPEPERVRLEGDAVLEATIEPVSYRDALGSRYTGYRPAAPLEPESIFRLREQAEGDPDPAGQRSPGPIITSPAVDSHDEIRRPPEPLPHDHPEHEDDFDEHAGHVHADGPNCFAYQEWDHRAATYKQSWCLLREATLPPAGSSAFYRETLQAYRHLVPEIRRQLEGFAATGLRRLRRQPDGEELDLDACIEALADLRAGLPADDRLYIRKQIAERDVAVVFLLDLSSSTADRVTTAESSRPIGGSTLHGKTYSTIIDVEKESVAVCMAAMQQTGDAFGIYGFSGSGRSDVRFVVIKDIEERMSQLVAARIDALKPIHTTRMGAAIRHAARKLHGHDARTKLLLLVSDGRPFDHDYGQQYGEGAEVEYAIRDTRKALDEARGAGIRTYVLTVDQGGMDYLRDMCDGIDYEVLADMSMLPVHLLNLYRRLVS